jgi:serine/threonine-protein kinase RsbW
MFVESPNQRWHLTGRKRNVNMSTDPPTCNFEADKLVLQLKVTLAADQNAVDSVVQGVMQIVRQMQCAAGKEDDIELALTEALANAVVHGAKSDPSQIIECDVACDETRGMLIVVRDPGPGFDPAQLPSPLQGHNLFSNHGRGIYLINQLMDEVKFHNNGTEIRMIKR